MKSPTGTPPKRLARLAYCPKALQLTCRAPVNCANKTHHLPEKFATAALVVSTWILPLSFAGDHVPPPLPNSQRSSHVRTTCSFDQLHVNAMEYFRSGLADSKHRTYSAAQRLFLSFCDTYGLSPLPALEDTLILFVTSLAARIKPQSTSVYLAGIRSLHVANGYDNPLIPGLRLKQTLRGIERKHFAPPKRKMPIIITSSGIVAYFAG